MRLILTFFMLLISTISFSQQFVRGKVVDEKNNPIPYAKIFVKNAPEFRTVSNIEGVYELSLMPSEYFLIFDASGFEERETYISINNSDLQKDMMLFPSKVQEFESIDFSVKKTNPGRDIMLKVVAKRDQINPWNYPHSVDVYIKASETIDFKQKDIKNKKEVIEDDDPLAEEKKDVNLEANKMNLVEVNLQRNYMPIGKVKEFRNAYTLRGSARTLYYTTTVKSNFNFFENLLHLDDLHQTPVSSPISSPGILSYKYKLEAKYEENGQMISKIKISPRNTATTTLEGYIWVIDTLWLVQKLELTMNKGNLLIYDHFTIKQTFTHPGDSICVLSEQTLEYGVKYKTETSTCSTIALFDNYNFKPKFDAKFFGTELAVTTKEAYEKDTAYWATNRPANLSEAEKRFILIKDSIHDAQNRVEYLDSVDRIFNKITALKILWFGVDHRNRPNKTQWTIGSVATFVQPIYIAGPRLTPSFDYFKKWKDERTLESYTRVSYGLINGDIKGDTWWKYRFDPFHFGTVRASINHDFDVIRGFDAITQVYKRENFIETTKLRGSFTYELFNGFYFGLETEFSERRSIENYKFVNIFNNVIPNNNPTEFNTYQAMLGIASISYTPFQKYMREPYRKVLLGSAYPTFSLFYERGVPKLFGSDINHEYMNFNIMQTFKFKTLGTTSYRIAVGKFLSAKILRDPDYKYQRRSDPIWFSNPLYSFQGLDSSLVTKDFIYEAHFVHHDNGSIINKIPLMKKTRIGLVVGGGAMYVKQYNYQHYELLAGLERTFKLSRRRLRIGVYGVVSDGNQTPLKATWKVSFAILDDRNMKWNF